MGINRREFLAQLAAWGASGVFASCVRSPLRQPPTPEPRLLLAGAYGKDVGWLTGHALSGAERFRIFSSLRHAHGYVPLPAGRVLVLDKAGPSAALVHCGEGKLLREIRATAGREFYGHGAYSVSRNQVLTVEAPVGGYSDDSGVIVARHPETLEAQSELHSHGSSPHDILLFEDQSVYAICNGGSSHAGRSTIAFGDLRSGRLLHETIAGEDNLLFGHLARVGNGLVATTQAFSWSDEKEAARWRARQGSTDPETRASAAAKITALKVPRPSATVSVTLQGEQHCWQQTPNMLSGFSVAVSGGAVAVSHGPSHGVAFFSVESGQLIHFLELPESDRPSAVAALPGGDFSVGAFTGKFWRVRAPHFGKAEPHFRGVSSEHSFWWNA